MASRKPRKAAAEAPQLDVTPTGDAVLLSRYPRIKNATPRPVYFDSMPSADTVIKMTANGYAPIALMSMPRDDERDHKNFLFALAQGMAEGTINADKDRLHATELDMRAHGMLSKYGPRDMSASKRKQSVEDVLIGWQKGRHALGQSSVVDPAAVELMLRERAGLRPLQEIAKAGKLKLKWKRKTRGTSED